MAHINGPPNDRVFVRCENPHGRSKKKIAMRRMRRHNKNKVYKQKRIKNCDLSQKEGLNFFISITAAAAGCCGCETVGRLEVIVM